VNKYRDKISLLSYLAYEYRYYRKQVKSSSSVTRSSVVAERPRVVSLSHVRSLKIIRNGTVRNLGYGFLFALTTIIIIIKSSLVTFPC